MPNKNALISIAYVSTNSNNPFSIFCEYIKYCIFIHPSWEMTISEIQEAVKSEFGIAMPKYIINKCIQDIIKEGVIIEEKHQIKRIGSYDTNNFDNIRLQYQNIENNLIRDLIQYVKEYGKDWTVPYAREQLIKVLDRNGLASDIFLDEKLYLEEEDNIFDETLSESETQNYTLGQGNTKEDSLFLDTFFVGKYIEKVLSEESPEKEYLKKICDGMMLCAGAYQLSYKNSKPALPHIKETQFFFDTRLLLRFLGCAGEVAVQATQELVNLIRESGGRIYYYPQTLDEIVYAFDDAIKCISNNDLPSDPEMLLYISKIKNDITILSAKKATVKEELAKSSIYLRDLGIYSDDERIRYGFDQSDFKNYMFAHLNWNTRTIENDAKSLWETHMLRRGNYREYIGTNDRLSVFVTSNSKLMEIALKYHEDRPEVKAVGAWNKNRLPVITDIRLTCRLWWPSRDDDRFSLLYLWTNTVAAQQPTRYYFESIRERARELKEQIPEYSEICLSEFFDDNITNKIFETTRGGEEDLDIGTFASSLEELAELKVREEKENTKKVEADRDSQKNKLDRQTHDLIDDSVAYYQKKFWPYNILLWVALNWDIVVLILFTIVTCIISYLCGSLPILFAIAVAILICLLERIFSSQSVRKIILKKLIPKIEASYEEKIEKSMYKVVKPYKTKIIKDTEEKLPLLCKAKKILNEVQQN